MPTRTSPTDLPTPVSPRLRGLDTYFYFAMAILVLLVVGYGFSFTVKKALFERPIPPPRMLYLHVAVFTGWLVLFAVQSGLVRAGRTPWHRRLGWAGLALGIAVAILGPATAVQMARFNTTVLKATDAATGLVIPLFDILCFTTAFSLAAFWRKKPEHHRRLMLIATCVLTSAAFGRVPAHLLHPNLFYLGPDLLILLGMARDLAVLRRVHAVYAWSFPLLLAGQACTMYVLLHEVPVWSKVAHAILW